MKDSKANMVEIINSVCMLTELPVPGFLEIDTFVQQSSHTDATRISVLCNLNDTTRTPNSPVGLGFTLEMHCDHAWPKIMYAEQGIVQGLSWDLSCLSLKKQNKTKQKQTNILDHSIHFQPILDHCRPFWTGTLSKMMGNFKILAKALVQC